MKIYRVISYLVMMLVLAVPIAAKAQVGPSYEVALKEEGRTFVVPVQINGAITLDFTVDSGAADVQIPVDVFSTLVRAKTIVASDFIGEQIYTLADGSTQKEPRFIVRELKVGGYVLRNVPASVSPRDSVLLLGESFLSRFAQWTLDNEQHVLRLVEKSAEPVSQTPPPSPPSISGNPIKSTSAQTTYAYVFMMAQTSMGVVISSSNGMTLYTYDKDTVGQSNCYGDCAQNWPPYLTSSAYKPFGKMTIISRTDGTQQWAYDGRPLYTFVQDTAPGEIKGNDFHNNWHVVPVPAS